MTVVRIGQPERRRRPPLFRRPVTPGLAVLIIGAIVVLRLWVVETAIVDGQSMEPTFHSGDRVLVLKALAPRRFDILVLREPGSRDIVIKRLLGMPRDTVSMVPRPASIGESEVLIGSQLYIDSQPYEEPYADSLLPRALPPTRVPVDSYFVMGDNRDLSTDSRHYGPVPADGVQGVAVAVVYPPSAMRMIERDAGRPAAGTSAAGE